MNKDTNTIGIVRQMVADGQVSQEVAEKYFPELKESEDEKIRKAIVKMISDIDGGSPFEKYGIIKKEALAWLEKQGEKGTKRNNEEIPNFALNEEDEYHKRQILRILKDSGCSQTLQEKTEKWIEERFKSLRPQNTWKPSEEMLEALYRAIQKNVMEISEDEMLLDKLYQGLKYGRVLSKN